VLGPSWRDASAGKAQPKPPQEILDAYFRIAGAGGEELSECKLIVVGRGGAGKTSLIKRLRGCPFDPNESETHGITIQKTGFRGTPAECHGASLGFQRRVFPEWIANSSL
jgi:hypothetical protein